MQRKNLGLGIGFRVYCKFLLTVASCFVFGLVNCVCFRAFSSVSFVSTSAIDCLDKLVSEVTCYMLSGC